MKSPTPNPTFKQAVRSAAALSAAYRAGLKALGKDAARVCCSKARQLVGSVNVDRALAQSFPNQPRWDYVIGWQDGASGSHVAIWVEVHPASSSHVNAVIAKVGWLKKWAEQDAPQLLRMTRYKDGFVWLATKSVSLPKTSPQARRLASAGVSFPRTKLRLE